MSTDLWGAWVDEVAEAGCDGGSGVRVEQWDVDLGVVGQTPPARRCLPLSGERGQRRRVLLHQSYTACVRKSLFKRQRETEIVFSLLKCMDLKWFTYSRCWRELFGKVLHPCPVDLVVKVNKISPLFLKSSWMMCWWGVGCRHTDAVVNLICKSTMVWTVTSHCGITEYCLLWDYWYKYCYQRVIQYTSSCKPISTFPTHSSLCVEWRIKLYLFSIQYFHLFYMRFW